MPTAKYSVIMISAIVLGVVAIAQRPPGEFPDPFRLEPAYGSATVSPSGEIEVNSMATITVTYTAGPKGFPREARLRVGYSHLLSDWGIPQVEDPQGADYLGVYSRRPLTLEPGGEINVRFYKGPSHDYYAEVANEAAALKPGDKIELVFGDRRFGGPGTVIQSYDERDYLMEVAVTMGEEQPYHLIENLKIQLVGAEARRLVLFAPSIVEAGKLFDVAVKAEDAFTNRSPGYRGRVEVALDAGDGRMPDPAAFSARDRGVHLFRGLRINRPGVYYLNASDGQGLAGLSNPIVCRESAGSKLYWGELHGHTELSDGRGTADNYYTYSRDTARIDFSAMTDHDIQNKYGLDYMWDQARRAARAYQDDGRFVTFLAFEWSGRSPDGGDHCTFFFNDQQPDPGFQLRPITALWAKFAQWTGTPPMTIPHVGGRVGNWDFHDDRFQRVGEMYSDHGSFEWFIQDALGRGHKVGLVAGSDDHQGRPGYSTAGSYFANRGGLTAVYAPELTRKSVWDHLYARHCYATSGPRIFLEATMGDALIGDVVDARKAGPLEAHIAGTGPLLQIDVVRNNETVHSHNVGGRSTKNSVRHLRLLWHKEPKSPRERGAVYDGRIMVRGGSIRSVKGLHFDSHREGVRGWNEQEIRLQYTSERADPDGVLFALEGGERTRIEIALEEMETQVTIDALDRLRGQWTTEVDPFVVTLTEVAPDAPRVARFTYHDQNASDAGVDFYYLRVVQIDGHMAWSSPIWVERR